MSSGNPRVVTIPGAATVQTNQPAPAQFANARTQYSGSTSYGDSSDVLMSEVDPSVDPAAPPPARTGFLKLYGRSDRGLVVRKPDGRIVPVRPPDIHVEDYAPIGELLTNSNFDTAFRAAWAAAWAIQDSPRIIIPPGKWTLGQFTAIGKSTGNLMPSLIGPGSSACTLQFDPHLLGPCILLDGYQGGAYAMLAGMKIQGMTITALGGTGEGIAIQMQACIMCELHDVTITGFAGGDGYYGGVCLFMRGNENDLTPRLENNQNITLYRCTFGQSQTALRLAGSGPVHAYNLICNQNRFADVLIDGGMGLSIHSGMLQGDKGGRAPTDVYYGDPGYVIRHAGYRTGRAGAAAALAAPSGGLTTVTGLAGMPSTCAGSYLYFSGQANAQNNGLYRIESYISATSVSIRKASGTSVSGVTWENRQNMGGSVVTMDGHIYHEGNQDAMILTETPSTTYDHFVIKGLYSHNVPTFAVLNGTARFECDFQGAYESTPFLKARGCASVQLRGAPDPVVYPTHYDLDGMSRFGIHVIDQQGRVYSGRMTRGVTPETLLTPYASEVFMSERGLVISSGAIQSWVGLLNGTTWDAPAAGQRCIFTEWNASMGGRPSVGARFTGARMLAGTLAAAAKIPIGSQWGILSVHMVPRGANVGGGAKRGPQVYSSATVNDWRGFGWQDGDGAGLNTFNKLGGNYGANPGLSPTLYEPIVVLDFADFDYGDPTFSQQRIVARSATGVSNNYNSGFRDATTEIVDKIQLCGNPGDLGNSNDLEISFFAIINKPIPEDVLTEIMKLLADRYCARMPRGSARPVQTGTINMVGFGHLIRVDVSGGAATVNVPSGDQVGDEFEVKLTTTAANSCTITPSGGTVDGAATQVMNTNYEYGRFRSAGGGAWMRVGKS